MKKLTLAQLKALVDFIEASSPEGARASPPALEAAFVKLKDGLKQQLDARQRKEQADVKRAHISW